MNGTSILWWCRKTSATGCCQQRKDREVEIIQAKSVIFATGGYGRVFKITTNAYASTADGAIAAFNAGVPLEDPEFVQFHPQGCIVRNFILRGGSG